jgi:transposase
MAIQVLTGVERRRRWRWDEKIRLVEETLIPGNTVAEVSRRHGVATSLLFYWRRLARDGQLSPQDVAPVLMPVDVTSSASMVDASDRPVVRSGLIEIDLGGGRCVRVDADVDSGALGRVLDVLARR